MTGGALTLDAAGPAAGPVAVLSWALFIGGFVILAMVLAGLWIAFWGPERLKAKLAREKVILGLGFFFPIAVLTVLLVIGLSMTSSLASSAERPGSLNVRVTGEQWWWRIDYEGFETANELVIPVGHPVRLELRSTNVIHSFWVPQLGGKRDMIPGRANYLNLQADRPGTYFGICAEYCGGPHALMQFRVRALTPADYAAWEAGQRLPANAGAVPGYARFEALGCATCHTVRGTTAAGIAGPDLTHVSSRTTIGAGVLPNTVDNLSRWTIHTDEVKPGSLMPAYPHLSTQEADAVSRWMASLE